MTIVEQWETLTHQSPVRAFVRHSPLDAFAGRDLTARGVVVLGCTSVGGFAALEIALNHHLGITFGVVFVLVSIACALAADVHALFAPGVLPPLLMVGVMAVVAGLAPEAINVAGMATTASTMQRAIAGIIDHATALVIAHVLALSIVGLRIWSAPDARAGGVRREPSPARTMQR